MAVDSRSPRTRTSAMNTRTSGRISGVVDLDGDVNRLTDDGYNYSAPAWSADGARLVVRGNEGLDIIIREARDRGAPSDLFVFDAENGTRLRNLTADWDLIPGGPTVSADGGQVYFSAGIRGNTHLFRVPEGGGAVEQVTAGDRRLGSFSFSEDFSRVAFRATAPTEPGDVWVADVGAAMDGEVRLSEVNRDLLAGIELSSPERLSFRSPDGTEVEGWMLPARGYAAGQGGFPMVLQMHGGPHGAYGNTWSFDQQLLAAQGYMVLFTNPRASTGYGEDFRWGTWGGWGFNDYDDVMAGVDHAIERYEIDTARMGATGYSYGGFLTKLGHHADGLLRRRHRRGFDLELGQRLRRGGHPPHEGERVLRAAVGGARARTPDALLAHHLREGRDDADPVRPRRIGPPRPGRGGRADVRGAPEAAGAREVRALSRLLPWGMDAVAHGAPDVGPARMVGTVAPSLRDLGSMSPAASRSVGRPVGRSRSVGRSVRGRHLACLAALLALVACRAETDLSPERWAADYDRFMEAQLVDRTEAGVATGENGAVSVAYNGLAARAGLEALKQGGNAIDAAMTTSLMQVALTAGAPISYFGIMSLVYYDAGTDRVYTMNAEWNTVLGEDDPANIPGGIDLSSPDGIYGTEVSGRTALVGGFMKGVGAAHERFGRLPWAEIFKPSIHVAEQGFPISKKVEGYWEGRAADLARLPETKATFLKEDGSPYVEGDVLRQPALAATLRAVAEQGTGYMYGGPWAGKAAAAIQADGGRMTVEDLAAYEVIWDEPLVADLGDGWELYTTPPAEQRRRGDDRSAAARGGVRAAGGGPLDGIAAGPADGARRDPRLAARLPAARTGRVARRRRFHAGGARHAGPRRSAVERHPGRPALRQLDAARPRPLRRRRGHRRRGQHRRDHAQHQRGPVGQDRDRRGRDHGRRSGVLPADADRPPRAGIAPAGAHPDRNPVPGRDSRAGLRLDGVRPPPPHLPGAAERDAVRHDGGRGDRYARLLHAELGSGDRRPHVPRAGREVPRAEVLDGTGYAYEEIQPMEARFGGEGLWVAIQRDPETGELRAASHNRNNSAAVAF